MDAREERSRTQSLYLHPDSNASTPHHFRVFGASGKLYLVCLMHRSITCDCPDWLYNGGLVCKHAVFVTRQVLGVPLERRDLWTQRQFSAEQCAELEERMRTFWVAREQRLQAATNQRDEECGVCIEAITDAHAVFTCPQCRHCIHRSCFTAWQRQSRRQGREATCPFCRFRCP